MARGKYLSLEEARKSRKLKQFAKEHQSEAEAERFEKLMEAMADSKAHATNQSED